MKIKLIISTLLLSLSIVSASAAEIVNAWSNLFRIGSTSIQTIIDNQTSENDDHESFDIILAEIEYIRARILADHMTSVNDIRYQGNEE